ncbi:unnamed protein product [Trifolium pratense]|uniref:Uncharacterized protein n=1 Tax=Trifolium pratense TaxID=57577 RepID=A0ACB0JG24_TRIPR|nr:unnamed protein product [Trifolium pratense]
MKVKPSNNYSFDEAESLTDSLEAESQAIAESTEGCQSSPETWIQASPRSRKDSYCCLEGNGGYIQFLWTKGLSLWLHPEWNSLISSSMAWMMMEIFKRVRHSTIPRRYLTSNIQRNGKVEPKMQQKLESSAVPKRPLNAQQNVRRN